LLPTTGVIAAVARPRAPFATSPQYQPLVASSGQLAANFRRLAGFVHTATAISLGDLSGEERRLKKEAEIG
jgi:hypothetical protein